MASLDDPKDPNIPKSVTKPAEIADKYIPREQITRPMQNSALWEAGVSFGVAVVLIVVGAILIVWSFFNLSPHGDLAAAKAIAGTLLGSSGGSLLLKVRKEARDQLDQIRRDENVMAMISLINDDAERNQLIRQFSEQQMNPPQKKGFWKRLLGG